LSDLAPSSIDESFPEGFERDAALFGWKRDREVTGAGPLRVAGRTYRKGLGVHTRSSLGFDLAGGWRKLKVVVGLDDSTKSSATEIKPAVTFRVLVDGKVAKEIVKARGEAASELVVPVEGAKQVTLVADYGPEDGLGLHILGRADWADAHLVK